LIGTSNGVYLYGGYVRHDGTVVSTVVDTINVVYKKFAMEQLCKYGKNFMITPPNEPAIECKEQIQHLMVPIKDGERVTGALYLAMNTNIILGALSSIKSNGMGKAYLCNVEGALIVASDTVPVLQFDDVVKDLCVQVSSRVNGGMSSGAEAFEGKDGDKRLVSWSQVNESRWFVMLEIGYGELDQSRARLRNLYVVAGIVVFFIVLLYVYILVKFSILNPLVKLQKVVKDFASGQMYRAVNINHGVKNEIGLLYDDVEKMASDLVKITDSIRLQAVGIRDNSFELVTSSEHIRESVSNQATAVEEISTTIEQMSSSITETANIANETSTSSEAIASDIDNVAKASARTLESTEIVLQKIKIINEIAKRTDLLAINAAVEAARAGDNGKGFSTVAAEIKQLAERTKAAAASIDETSNRTLLVTKKSAKLIQQMAPRVLANAKKVSEIALACSEQRKGTEQINNAIQQLAHISEETNIEADALATKSESFVKYANELTSAMQFFKTADERTERFNEITADLEKYTNELEGLRRELAEYDQHVIDVAAVNNTVKCDEKDNV
nr:hypothetical protein [Bacteroidales bacterium]